MKKSATQLSSVSSLYVQQCSYLVLLQSFILLAVCVRIDALDASHQSCFAGELYEAF